MLVGDPVGSADRLLEFMSAVTGSLYVVPLARYSRTRRAATVADEPGPRGDLGIGDVRAAPPEPLADSTGTSAGGDSIPAMTAQPVHRAGAVHPAPATSPTEIRRGLLPEEAGQFDSEWRTATARAAEALDLSEVYRVLDRWQHIAAMTQADPEGHRRMLQRAGRVLTGQDQGTVTAKDQRATVTERLAAATNASDGIQS